MIEGIRFLSFYASADDYGGKCSDKEQECACANCFLPNVGGLNPGE